MKPYPQYICIECGNKHGRSKSNLFSTWHFCETCADLAASISELGLCFDINEPLKDQISEFNAGLGR